MKTLNNLQLGQTVQTANGEAIVYSFSSYGTRRGDIRKEVKESEIEYPTLRGLKGSFIGFIRVVPENVSFLYGGEAKESFIIK